MNSELFRTENLCFADFLGFPDMSIPSGKTTFITGESGTGKSTLLKLFNCTQNPSRGKIFFRQAPLEEYPVLSLRKRVSLVSQEPFLFAGSIGDNFRKFFQLRGEPMPETGTISFFLDLCKVGFSPEHPVTNLSGGEKQRVYISLFLSLKPEVLMLDEPTSALDEDSAAIIFNRLIPYCRENRIDIIVVSHESQLKNEYSDHTINLERGISCE